MTLTSIRQARHLILASALVVAVSMSAPIDGATRDERQGTTRVSANTRQVQQILTRVRTDAAALRQAIQETNPSGRAVGNPRVAENDALLYLVDDVVQSSRELTDRVSRNQASSEDVSDILRHSAELNDALEREQLRPVVTNAWARMRRSIEQLASAYSMPWDWQNPQYASSRSDDYSRSFTGTFRLSSAESDDPRVLADNAVRTASTSERARLRTELRERLTPPETIAISRSGDRITIASSEGPQTTFQADGQNHTETGLFGRRMTTRAISRGSELDVSTSGSGSSDFALTLESLDDERSLSVTRRLYDQALREPVVARSLYHRTSDTADWNVYDDEWGSPRSSSRADDTIIVPTGSTFTARLDRTLNVQSAREGDRINLTVVSQNEFSGATIQGFITSEPTRASSRDTGISIAFDRIRLRDGRTGEFDGTIQDVRDPDGKTISFDRAERASGDDRRDQAVQRGAIGAAIGAVLGAVIAGGKGAAVGAVLGAGGGAGTVLINPSQPNLPSGTEFTIRSEAIKLR